MKRSYQVDRHPLVEGSMFGLLEFTVVSYSSFTMPASCASLTPRFYVFLHLRPVKPSLDQGSSPHYSLVGGHGVVVACLKNMGSERLGGHHLPLGIYCNLLPPAVCSCILNRWNCVHSIFTSADSSCTVSHGGQTSWSRRSSLTNCMSGSSSCTAARLRVGQSRTSSTWGSTSSAEVTTLTR